MDDDKKLSRGQFLAIVGGMVIAIGFAKFGGIKKALTATRSAPRLAHTAYGNSTYGGKTA